MYKFSITPAQLLTRLVAQLTYMGLPAEYLPSDPDSNTTEGMLFQNFIPSSMGNGAVSPVVVDELWIGRIAQHIYENRDTYLPEGTRIVLSSVHMECNYIPHRYEYLIAICVFRNKQPV